MAFAHLNNFCFQIKWWKTHKKIRGKTWKKLRSAITWEPGKCKPENLINAVGFERKSRLQPGVTTNSSRVIANGQEHPKEYMSHTDMCNNYQVSIAMPGNGDWSIGTKYALLCNSVLIMPEWSANSETATLNLEAYKDFLPISRNVSSVCQEVKNHVKWVIENQERASQMALQSRKKVLAKLNSKVLHENLLKFLLEYHALQKFEPQVGADMMEWVTYKKCGYNLIYLMFSCLFSLHVF